MCVCVYVCMEDWEREIRRTDHHGCLSLRVHTTSVPLRERVEQEEEEKEEEEEAEEKLK